MKDDEFKQEQTALAGEAKSVLGDIDSFKVLRHSLGERYLTALNRVLLSLGEACQALATGLCQMGEKPR